MSDPNPYAPPKAPVADPIDTQSGADILASRGQRAAADLLDTLIASAWLIPVWRYFQLWDYILRGEPLPLSLQLLVAALGFALFALCNAYFLRRNGQTLGKLLLRIRIATLDGGVPKLWRILALRYAPLSFVAMLPTVGVLLSTIDVLFIFRADRRCVHDLIAGTKVVRISRAGAARA
jgi:uncharacterized RDD family membrane protein YckC